MNPTPQWSGRSALIGHTGLVGSNLVRQFKFDHCYNSTNIRDIAGERFDLLVCSGARGTKWIANREPERDLSDIMCLLENLKKAQAEYLILISTVDVFGIPYRVDEDTPVDPASQTHYGRHRHYVEQVVSQHFPNVLIVRLPGLFGRGLKKNALYDLMHNHEIEKIHPDSTYELYWLDHAWKDIQRAVAAGLTLCHFATAPLRIRDVAKEIFDLDLKHTPPNSRPAAYDFKTKYDRVFGGSNGYLQDGATVMADIRAFVEWHRRGGDLT